MIEILIPGSETCGLEHLVLDVNGTIACDGRLVEGVAERLHSLQNCVCLHLVTADTHGRQREIDHCLGLRSLRIGRDNQARQKLDYVRKLSAASVCAIGNGANDCLMLEQAALGIAVIGREGAAIQALMRARIVVTDINDALDLLLHPQRVTATLRQ